MGDPNARPLVPKHKENKHVSFKTIQNQISWGILYRGHAPGGMKDRIYYIRYRKGEKLIEEKAGSQSRDAMT